MFTTRICKDCRQQHGQTGDHSGREVGFGAVTTPSGVFQSEVVVHGLAEFLLAAQYNAQLSEPMHEQN